jgi:hypothetical protein
MEEEEEKGGEGGREGKGGGEKGRFKVHQVSSTTCLNDAGRNLCPPAPLC